MTNRVTSLDDALALVPSGALLGVGGALLKRKPVAFLSALAAAGRRELRVLSFLSSLDAELLAAYGCVSELHCGYVGFEQLGFAPAVNAATDAGTIRRVDYNEVMFASGLRAALAGLPFLPTRAGTGSQVTADLGIKTISCPYTGEQLLAAPAIRPEVTVLHADAADREGNILGPEQADFLFDMDANLARAAKTVIVTVERIVESDETLAANRRTLLFGFEIDAVVLMPDGARPTALPGRYGPAVNALTQYLDIAGKDPAQAAAGHGRTGEAMSLEIADRMVWRLANECRNDDVLIVGVGTPVAAAAGMLARELLVPDLTVLVAASVQPVRSHDIARPMIEADFVARMSTGSFGQADVLDLIGRGGVTLQFVAPAQIDRRGRLNASEVPRPDGTMMRLPGPLALPDVSCLVGRLVGYRAAHSKRFLVDEVDFVTGLGSADLDQRAAAGLTGAGLTTVITDLAVLRFHPTSATVERGVARAGRLARRRDRPHLVPAGGPDDVLDEDPPPAEAIELLNRVIDPHGVRGMEVPATRVEARARLEAITA